MIPVVRCKPGAKFEVIAPGGFRILAAIDGATSVLGHDLTIAAGTNDHDGISRHNLGEAYDVSVKDFAIGPLEALIRYLSQRLGPRFTVMYETPTRPTDHELAKIATVNPSATGPHLHIQTKKGEVYPPVETGTLNL